MKNKKKIKLLEKRLAQLEAVVQPSSITLTHPNDNNHKVVMALTETGSFESSHRTTTTQTQIITQEN